MKVHVGADVHTVSVRAANVADITVMPGLLRENDQAAFGDSAYQKKGYKQAAREDGYSGTCRSRARRSAR